MSTTTPSTTDNSITISLAELAKLEQQRVREEETARARNREQAAREQKEAEARQRAAEEARLAAEAEARTRRVREQAEQQARIEARERAAADVARIEAQAKARLETDNAQRAHELAMLRVRTESGKKRLTIALAAVLGLVVCGGSASAWAVNRSVSAIEQDVRDARATGDALKRERDSAKSTELATLDRRFTTLRARPLASAAEEARATAEAARNAVDPKTIDQHRLHAFGDALDAFEARIESMEKVAQLDRRFADLSVWAGERKRSEATAAARTAGTRAKLMGTADALRDYEGALDQLRSTLAQTKGATGSGVVAPPVPGDKRTCLAGDPGCGLDGKPIF